MQITLIGAGNMARGIATHALSGGHTVQIIDREPDKAAQLAAGLQETPQPPTSRQQRCTRLRCPARGSPTSPTRSTSPPSTHS